MTTGVFGVSCLTVNSVGVAVRWLAAVGVSVWWGLSPACVAMSWSWLCRFVDGTVVRVWPVERSVGMVLASSAVRV